MNIIAMNVIEITLNELVKNAILSSFDAFEDEHEALQYHSNYFISLFNKEQQFQNLKTFFEEGHAPMALPEFMKDLQEWDDKGQTFAIRIVIDESNVIIIDGKNVKW